MTDIPTTTFYSKVLLAARTVSSQSLKSFASGGCNSLGDRSSNNLSGTAWQGTLFFLTLMWQLLHM